MTLPDYVHGYRRKPTATVTLDGRRWRAILALSYSQRFGENIAGGTIEGRNPPVTPQVGMAISWTWGYGGQEVAGFTGEISSRNLSSYPNRVKFEVKDTLFRADKSDQVIQTDPLNEITARDAIIYILTHYGAVSPGRLSIPALSASGSAWVGDEWVLGVLTPVQWGDPEAGSGGTTALKAAAEICSCLGYWLYADSSGVVRAKLMERKPLSSAREVFRRNVNLLEKGSPERSQSYDRVFNQVTIDGASTGVEGAQIHDQRQTDSPLLPDGVYKDYSFSSDLIEYVNESEAGVASATGIAKRALLVVSRTPDIVSFRAKADPQRKVGDTAGIIDTGILLSSQKNYFIYALDRSLNLPAGAFDDQLTLDGGTGDTGLTTIPPPDAAFSWTLDAETLDGAAVVVVVLDGSGSTSPTGEIVSWEWSTDATPYAGTASTASGVQATLIFPATPSPVNVTLTVVDTTSKNDTVTLPIDLTGAGTLPPIVRTLSVAFGSSWTVTPDGGATVRRETTNGDAVSVPPYGAGIDDRALGTAATYGLLATRGSGGAGGLRQTLDALVTPSIDLSAATGAIACIWQNEANPARVWWAVGDTIYRSIDGGATGTAMAKPNAGTDVSWIIEDPAVDNSVFAACGPDLFNATDPVVGWALLYPGPIGATARQFVRSRDGQVTWVCYLDAPSGQAAQRVETGAFADVATTDIRTLALDKDASSLLATLTLIDASDPAQIYHVDGLTGLSAVVSPATFPAGATVMHMLADPDVPIYYTADFDSIEAGTGAVRKLIADQLLLMLAGETGQQAHMLGFGGPIVPPVVARLLMVKGNLAGGIGVWLRDPVTGLWTDVSGDLPDTSWSGVCASSLNVTHWIVWNDLTAYRTINSGVNWIELEGIAPGLNGADHVDLHIRQVEFSPTVLAHWALVGRAVDTFNLADHAFVDRGNLGAVTNDTQWISAAGPFTAPTDQTAPTGLTYAANDDLIIPLAHDETFGDRWIVYPGGTLSGLGTSLGSVPAGVRSIDGTLTLPAMALAIDPDDAEGELWSNNNPPGLVAHLDTFGISGNSMAAVSASAAYIGTTSGLVALLFSGAAPNVVAAAGFEIVFVRVDRQLRTVVAALYFDGANYLVAVFDGATWIVVDSLGDFGGGGDVAPWVEVLSA